MLPDRRTRRRTETVSYEISSDSDNGDSATHLDSSFSSPEKTSRKRKSIIDLEEDEYEEVEPPGTPPPRLSAAGHSLRQHSDLKLSLQARENADKPRLKKKKKAQKSVSKPKEILKSSDSKVQALPKTARNEIREFINTETAGKRANFLVAKKGVFLPLLPDGNHIQKLVAQHGQDAEDNSVPYEALEQQPAG